MKILLVDSATGEETVRDLTPDEIDQITQNAGVNNNIQENTQNNLPVMNDKVKYIVDWMQRENLANSEVIDSLIFLSSVQR